MDQSDRPINIEILGRLLARRCTHPALWLSSLGAPESAAALRRSIESGTEVEMLRKSAIDDLFKLIPALGERERKLALDLKRWLSGATGPMPEKFHVVFLALPAAFRANVERVLHLSAEVRALEAETEKLFNEEVTRSRRHLRETLGSALLQEGLYLSSEPLFEAAVRYLRSPPVDVSSDSKSSRQFERSIVEHLSRACFKTTPRGLLTGLGTIGWDEKSTDRKTPIEKESIRSRRTLLKLPLVHAIAERISSEDWAWPEIVPRLSPSLHFSGGRVHFTRIEEGTEFSGSLPESPILTAFLEAAATRNLNARELISRVALRLERGYSRSDVERFYLALVAKKVLIGKLDVPFERRDGLAFLIEWLDRLGGADEPAGLIRWRATCARLRENLDAIDRMDVGFGDRLEKYAELKRSLAEVLPGRETADLRNLIATDSISAVDDLYLDSRVRDDIVRAIRVCHVVFSARERWFNPYRYGRVYLKRIGLETADGENEIPLSALLDHDGKENGEGEELGNRGGAAARKKPEFDRIFEEWLEERKSKEGGFPESVDLLSGGLLDRMEIPSPEPGTRTEAGENALEFQIAARSADAYKAGDYQVVLSGMLPTLSPVFARFLDFVQDKKLSEEVHAHVRWLKSRFHPEKTWVDPLNYTGGKDTALLYTRLQKYGIELPGAFSEHPVDEIIPVRELFVRFEDEGALTLIWRKDGKEEPVHPYFCGLIDRSRCPTLTFFLAAIGWQVGSSVGDWLNDLPERRGYFPRLTAGKVVLRRARWKLEASIARANMSSDRWGSFTRWQKWRHENAVPRYVFVANRGSPFYVDFESPWSLGILNQHLSNVELMDLTLVEMLPSPDSCGSLATQFHLGARWEASNSP